MSDRVIARSLGLGRTTVGEYLRRASGAGLGWPLPAGLSDADLERLLFPAEAARAPHRPQPNWAAVHAELKRPGVTLRLLWEEYRGAHPDGYSLSRFTEDGEPGPDLAAADLALPASIGVESDPTGGCRSPAVGPVRPSPEGGRLGRIRWPG